MGYYTKYNIKISGADNANQLVKIAQELELSGYDTFSDGTALTTSFEDKWYGWEDAFKLTSKSYPRVLFEVDGKGEDSDDQWRARFRDGVSEIIYAKIIFDDFKKIK
jgi:hypothetical protein